MGRTPYFWEDRWLDGMQMQELAPSLYEGVSRRVKATRTVHEVISLGTSARDINPNMAFTALVEYLEVWQCLQGIQLQKSVADSITWSWETNGQFWVIFAYAALFVGREMLPTADFSRRSRAPL